jgi:tetratricopeptide (TPR) repeat protein/predicted Ser/Thr protein kinase
MEDDFEGAAELREARPAQTDLVARHLEARIREALVGVTAEPIRVGRFVVLERLGAGATGIVYAAFDPRLDRKVALKMVRTGGDTARECVLAEAQAMAKLSDPNVVAVYDALEAEGELFIAMELIAGCNLRRWLAAQPRSIAEIIAVFVQAGRGIATAHASGIIHGDIKPENILVGDGLVKVADFGLARAEAAAVAMRGGTLPYMAPEQRATGASIQSDQYAFAVSLYEAISGARPPTHPDGTAGADPPLLDAPVHVARAVARALLRDPGARYPSMTALLEVLAPAPRRPRGVRVLALAAAVIAAALVVYGSADRDRCGGGDARLAAVWSPAAQAGLSPVHVRAVDDYSRRWAEMARANCEATRHGEQSVAMLDLRTSCLDRRLDELAAFIAAAAPDDGRPAAATSAAFELSPIEACADRDRLVGVLPPPAAIRAQVTALRARIDRDRARQRTREASAALDDIERVVTEARALDYAPVLGEALLVRGHLQDHVGRFAAAAESFKDAAAAAGEGHDDDTLVSAWSSRGYALGVQLARRDEGLAYVDAAGALATRAQLPARQRAVLRQTAGEILAHAEQFDRGRAALEDAVRLHEQARGGDHPSVANALRLLANVCQLQGDLATARKHAERARAILTSALGPIQPEVFAVTDSLASISGAARDFPRALAEYRTALELARAIGDQGAIATTHTNIADLLRKLGRRDESREELERALTIFERTTGLDHDVAIAALSSVAKLTRDPAEARRRFEDVLARWTKLFGPAHRSVGDTINDLGNLARDHGDLAAATDHYERALGVYEKALGPNHPRLAVALTNLGEVALVRKQFDKALTACTRARMLDETTLGADHPDLAYDLACLGEATLGLGDARGALPLLERAVELHRAAAPDDRARAEFALARALWASGNDRKRARTLARPASQRVVIERWLATH